MSYNTRRTGPGSRGGLPSQTQVNYHQGNIGSGIGRNSRLPPNQGYNTSAPSAQNYPQQPFVSQGYSTAPPAPPAQKTVPSPSPAPAPVQQMPAPPPAPHISSLVPKVEDASPKAVPEQQTETNGEEGQEVQSHKPHWMKKGPAIKVSRKIRKRRQNARLRRLLVPKNSLMFLNELHSGARFTCQERINALSQFVYTVTVEVDGKVFTGQGMSKLAAKSQASENALKVLVLEKMAKSQMELPMESNSSADTRRRLVYSTCIYPEVNHPYCMNLSDNILPTDDSLPLEKDGNSFSYSSFHSLDVKNNDVEMEDDTKESICGDDAASTTEGSRRKLLPEDDLPWGSLAAFALHKLFAEWQQQGTQVPLAKSPTPVPIIKTVGPSPMKKIPEDASKRHPVLLLNQIRPGSTYKENKEGSPPNISFTISVEIDGKEYLGTGSNKREAKKECARAALAAMGIQSEA